VMPREMSSLYRTVQMWSPLVFPEQDRVNRGDHKYLVIGRLKSGVTLSQAREQMNGIAQRLEEQYKNGRGVRLRQIEELWTANVRSPLWMMMVAVGFVLLIACTNVANLLLARATVRRREIGIRIALGATAPQILRSVTGGAMVYLTIGGIIGSALGVLFLQIRSMLLISIPETGLSMPLTIFLTLATAGGIACWLPAKRALAIRPSEALNAD